MAPAVKKWTWLELVGQRCIKKIRQQAKAKNVIVKLEKREKDRYKYKKNLDYIKYSVKRR